MSRALCILKQVLAALAYLHWKGIVHRDIKLENIAMSVNKAKLIDFGFAMVLEPGQVLTASLGGTQWHRAPEFFK